MNKKIHKRNSLNVYLGALWLGGIFLLILLLEFIGLRLLNSGNTFSASLTISAIVLLAPVFGYVNHLQLKRSFGYIVEAVEVILLVNVIMIWIIIKNDWIIVNYQTNW